MLTSVLYLVIGLLVVGVIVWIIGQLPFIEEPYKKIAKGVILFAALIYVLFWLVSLLSGHPFGNLARP